MCEGNYKIKFRCSDETCGGEVLEEVMVNVTQSANLNEITDDGDIEYGDTSADGGVVDRYQCTRCGKKVPLGDDPQPDDLFAWLRDNNMLEQA